jgi:fructokinase
MSKKVICFGEMLWDVLPAGKAAGGAPMNVAIRLQSLGIDTSIVSKVGIDEPGNSLIDIIKDRGVNPSLVQKDDKLPTGEVIVSLSGEGIPSYNIVYPSAWDNIEFNEVNIAAVAESEAFVFGSLACRAEVSKNTLFELLRHAKYKVFDVNLRAPFYNLPLIEELMIIADMIKLNDDELSIIADFLKSPFSTVEDNVRFISEATNTHSICITMGADGALLFTGDKFYKHAGFKVKVADTIGAGDSFLAALLSKILNSGDYNEALKYACAVGALVASHKGANPDISAELPGLLY